MTWKTLVTIACLPFLFAVCEARASSIVPGSTFDVTLATYDDNTNAYTHFVTTTVPANGGSFFNYGVATVSILEFESTLATGQQQVTISLLSDSELFPDVSGDILEGLLGVGIFGNPMQFDNPFNLGSAILTFSNVTGGIHQQDFAGSVDNRNPYDGVFLSPNNVAGFMTVQNKGINRIDLQLTSALATTPEPSSLILLATSLLGVAGAVRRRLA